MFVKTARKKGVKMNNVDFEKLKKAIEQRMTELSCLQELYIKETGRCYIPSVLEQVRPQKKKENLRQYCTEW